MNSARNNITRTSLRHITLVNTSLIVPYIQLFILIFDRFRLLYNVFCFVLWLLLVFFNLDSNSRRGQLKMKLKEIPINLKERRLGSYTFSRLLLLEAISLKIRFVCISSHFCVWIGSPRNVNVLSQ